MIHDTQIKQQSNNLYLRLELKKFKHLYYIQFIKTLPIIIYTSTDPSSNNIHHHLLAHNPHTQFTGCPPPPWFDTIGILFLPPFLPLCIVSAYRSFISSAIALALLVFAFDHSCCSNNAIASARSQARL